ncbi:IS21 family transposase [Pseudoxanthomonas mexicana]|uniref:IS21 family transposase n=1 Tax=Pseudoxanthomonas mexicana TaxID=128785 RepID=UPI0022F3FA50|nr:IS21 family transposase [Pseudoxanthomonas mexicana]WBX94975.1 IS21 family transposase [Pseudoxanthomonas mexicana]
MSKKKICQLLLTTTLSARQIATQTEVSHNTVTRYREQLQQLGLDWLQVKAMTPADLDSLLNPGRVRARAAFIEPDWSHIHREMARIGVTGALLHQEYEAAHPDGGTMSERTFRRRYDEYVDSLRISMRQPRLPGHHLFVDYSGKRPCITDPKTMERRSVELWVGCIGVSRRAFAHATLSQKLPDFIESHVLALDYYGALSEVLTPDNLRSAVVSVSWRDGHVINPSYQAFADHYDVLVLPTRPRKPKEKAAVENTVRLMQRWVIAVLRDRTFYSLAELNAEVRRLVDAFNDRPMRGADKRSRNQLFLDVDLPVMRPLPIERYVYADWKIGVKVGKDYHVGFEGNWYSVPFRLIDERVEIRALRDAIEIYQAGRQVATHRRAVGKGEILTEQDHQTPKHRAFTEAGRSEMTGWATDIGEMVVEFVRRHLEKATGGASINAFRGLKQLKRQYGAHRLNQACRRALKMGAISTNALQSMLARGLEDKPLSDEATPVPTPVPAHENVRGATTYQDDDDESEDDNDTDEKEAV